jgi:hypothetical protein
VSHYTLLDGTGQPLWKTATPTDGENRSTPGVVKKRNGGVAHLRMRKTTAKLTPLEKDSTFSKEGEDKTSIAANTSDAAADSALPHQRITRVAEEIKDPQSNRKKF